MDRSDALDSTGKLSNLEARSRMRNLLRNWFSSFQMGSCRSKPPRIFGSKVATAAESVIEQSKAPIPCYLCLVATLQSPKEENVSCVVVKPAEPL